MNIVSIIEKKRDNKRLSSEEIQYWIDGLVEGSVADYQSSALLMAIVLNGMDDAEITDLTQSMLHSGDIIDLSEILGKKVDKHSTGGVGDKTSIILSPLVAAAGAKVAKMSGRGLGHTGGTLDKLESIPGYNIELSSSDFIKQVNDINVAVVGQTGNLVYADKVLYSLRDVTGTVNSIPLIASSIMSKKLAGGAECILLDVKFGEGAFMKTQEDARILAETMITIGRSLGKEVNALLSDMNSPLGNTIGNALEIHEAVMTLKNKGPKDLEDLCVYAAGVMLYQAGIKETKEEAQALALETLRSGAAYDRFLEWIAAQGGDISVFDDLDSFIHAQHEVNVIAEESGYLSDIQALELGLVSMHLGAGRQTVEDVIDMKAGITLSVQVGDKIEKGQVLCKLQSSSPIKDNHIADTISCFKLSDHKVDKNDLIAAVL